MAALDTDYASEPCTCGSDDDSSQEAGDTPSNGLGMNLAARQEKAGLGEVAKMAVGPVWRNLDVSTSQEASVFDDTHLIIPVHCFCPLAYLQVPQRKAVR